MNRLWVRLTLAFTAVVLVAIGAIALLADTAIGRNFRDFLARNQIDPESGGLVAQLVGYYEQAGSWQGVDDWLGRGPGEPAHPGGRPRLEITLADADGLVVYSNHGHATGALLPAERDVALVLASQERPIGYLVAAPGPIETLRPPERAFVDQVRQTLLLAGLIAIGIGLLLGLALSHSLARPLNRLALAARVIAAKDFTHRVTPGSTREVAEVAHAFNDMAASLEKAEVLRRNLVADVAHELRTPLSVLQGNLTALLDGVYSLDMSEVARLYDETRLLNRLVGDLRELAQAEAGQLNLNVQSIDVSRVAQATVDAFGAAAEEKQVTLSANLPADLPAVRADAERVAQALRNLLSNALRHTPAGGAIAVAAVRAPGGVEISVSDTGEGIAAQDVPYVFDRFWRGDKSRARETGGSGLGLAITRRLIEAQGGQMGVESQIGQGSRFWFKLPAEN